MSEMFKNMNRESQNSENSVSIEDQLKVYELCKTHLGGHWSDVSADQLDIKRLTGGIINKSYCCSLPQSAQTGHDKVFIRFNVDSPGRFFDKTHELVENIFASQADISPKILGIFGNGFITEYIDCHYFTAEDDLNPRCVALLAKKVAKMHSLDVPIAKDSHQFLMKNYWVWFAAPVFESYKKGHIYEEIQRHKLQTFMEMDLCDEMSWAIEVSVG
ncbi:unnamed protein product, partial [Oppiella nova]